MPDHDSAATQSRVKITSRDAIVQQFSEPERIYALARAEGWRARTDAPPFPIALPLDWLCDPFRDRNWRFHLNAWRPVETALLTYERRGDREALRFALDCVFDWIGFAADKPGDPVLWLDMAAGLRATKIAFLLADPAIREFAGAGGVARLEAAGHEHLRRLRDPGYFADSNHALFQVQGAKALALTLPGIDGEADLSEHIRTQFRAALKTQFSEEAVHREHSPDYHYFALLSLNEMLASGWYADMPDVHALVARAQKNLDYFIMPDGRVSAIGNSTRRELPRAAAQTSVAVTALFRETGYAIVKAGAAVPPATQFALIAAASHFSPTHKHFDDLSFELYDRGRYVFTDTGKYSYSDKLWRDFTRSPRAHNTVEYDFVSPDNGAGNSPPAGSGIRGLDTRDWGYIISGSVKRQALAISHRRWFLYRPNAWLVLADRLEAGQDLEMTAWLHLAPDIAARAGRNKWFLPFATIAYKSDCAPARLVKTRGQLKGNLQGWAATGYHERVPRTSLGYAFEGRAHTLFTVFCYRDSVAPVADAQSATVSWEGQTIFRLANEPGNR